YVEYVHDARQRGCCSEINCRDGRMRERTPPHRHVQRPGQREVVDERAATGQQPRVVAASGACPELASTHVGTASSSASNWRCRFSSQKLDSMEVRATWRDRK